MATVLTEEILEKMKDEFFSKRKCDRCGGSLTVRTMSFFTEETICGDCGTKEMELRRKMREQGDDPDKCEGCGYVPKLKEQEDQDGDC